jgi:hypothetical protein
LELWKLLKKVPKSECFKVAKTKGICINAINNRFIPANEHISSYLRHQLEDLGMGDPPYILIHNKCMLDGILYQTNDDVVVVVDEPGQTPYKAQIVDIFSHDHKGFTEVYFSAKYYKHSPTRDNRGDMVDPITHMHLVHKNVFVAFNDKCIRPMRCILHKFMLIGNPVQGKSKCIAYEMEDCRSRNQLTLERMPRT